MMNWKGLGRDRWWWWPILYVLSQHSSGGTDELYKKSARIAGLRA
jgi:hypothetical protein